MKQIHKINIRCSMNTSSSFVQYTVCNLYNHQVFYVLCEGKKNNLSFKRLHSLPQMGALAWGDPALPQSQLHYPTTSHKFPLLTA